jgi:F-type H+-transporting ATPase subunit b
VPNRPNRWTRARHACVPILALAMAAPVIAAEPAAADPGWTPIIAKLVNFALLVGLLVYFLRGFIVAYLRSRGEAIRQDLTDAAALRASAEQQLLGVRLRLTALPAELDALRRRGQDELAAELVRIREVSAKEQERLVDRARRDVELQFRVARRELIQHVAELSMTLARARIEREMTADDQTELIDRYAAQVQS